VIVMSLLILHLSPERWPYRLRSPAMMYPLAV
jgi:hypothetical protein